jgi:hypothetical protein
VSGGNTVLNGQKLLLCATASTLESPAGVIQNPPSWYTNRSGDIWYRFTTNAAIRFKLTVTGIPNCLVAIYTTANCSSNSYTEIHQQASTGNQIVTPELLLTASTTYRIRLAGLPTSNFHSFSIRIDAL